MLTGIKVLVGSDMDFPARSLSIGRPRPDTETLVCESYVHEAGNVTRILRRGEQTDGGQKVDSCWRL